MNYSAEEMARFRDFYERSRVISKENRMKSVEQLSPYSRKINVFIRNTKELQIYTQLNLKETVITRTALILDIDPYYCDSSGISNIDKMLSGKSPIDSTTGDVIDLHHIGQSYDSPFAELPHSFHELGGNYSILHTTKTSWRNDKELVKLTTSEFANYWRIRGEMICEKF